MNLPNHILALDFETTGLTTYDNPTSLTIVEFQDGDPTGQVFDTKIRVPDTTKISLQAIQVQAGERLTASNIANFIKNLLPDDAPDQREAMKMLADWTQGNGLTRVPVVAQHAPFDWGFLGNLERNTTAFKGAYISPVWICTKVLARHAFPDAKSISLDALCVALNLPRRESTAHDSKEDAILAGRVYFALKEILDQPLLS
jgi:DNA polymerase III epsilon subunit-like protein